MRDGPSNWGRLFAPEGPALRRRGLLQGLMHARKAFHNVCELPCVLGHGGQNHDVIRVPRERGEDALNGLQILRAHSRARHYLSKGLPERLTAACDRLEGDQLLLDALSLTFQLADALAQPLDDT